MYKRTILAVILTISALLILTSCSSDSTTLDGDDLSIHQSQITETVLFESILANNTVVEVMFARASDGNIRVALNTCENCHASGNGYYVQEGNIVICQQCNMDFDIDYIGINSGGCQPIPIEHSFNGEYIVIEYSTLSASSRWFVNSSN
ncbi:MAG: DUF2318 domain-containing protein [Defluviitaleaceae bacterium]|nr:DUF2318 domain-containing protein [Defluviitaleaceae bacterium]